MGKGSQPSGTTTTTQTNPTQAAQLPYLQSGWGQAQNLYNTDPLNYYPNQTLANFDPNLASGYGNLAWNAQGPMQSNALAGQNAFMHAANGGMSVQNSPAFSGLNQSSYGQSYPEQQLQSITNATGNWSASEPGTLSPYINNIANGNPADSLLYGTASGQFLGSNPYIAGEYGAAAQPTINSYMTATAPQTDSAMEAAGRYGSGALGNAQSQNQLNLGTTLGNLASNLYGQDYANERGLMTQAQGTLGNLALGQSTAAGSLENQALQNQLQGMQLQGNQAVQGEQLRQNALSALQSGYQTGNQQQLSSLYGLPGLQQAYQAGPMAQIQAGQGLTGLNQAQIQDQMNRYYGNQQAPWQTLNQTLSAYGQPTSGSSSTTSPYFQNPVANILGAGFGGLGLYNGLNQAGLLGGGSGGYTGGAANNVWNTLPSAGNLGSDIGSAGSAAQDFSGGSGGPGILGTLGKIGSAIGSFI